MFNGLDLHALALWLVVAIIALTFHEYAHGWMANRRGDPTARLMGRLSLNPVVHIDTFGTIILPLMMRISGLPFMFGWAKPVPFNPRYFKSPRLDSALVAVAGPLANLLLAVLAVGLLRLGQVFELWHGPVGGLFAQLLLLGLYLNVSWAIFNLLPFPPLDGSKVLMAVLPPRYAIMLARLERHGLVIVLGGLMVLPWLLQSIGIPFDPLEWLLVMPVQAVVAALISLVGLQVAA